MKARTLEKSSSPTTLGAHVPANNGDHGQRTTDSGRPACPRFVVTLDSSLTSGETLARIPLAVTGKWVRDGNPFSITLEDLG